jgi:peptide chain release factor subunit 3
VVGEGVGNGGSVSVSAVEESGGEAGNEVAADSWEAAAEDSDPATTLLTPEEDDEEDGEGEEEEEEVVIKPKKKPPRTEETRSKKEHVNVVIIGHVGQSHVPFNWIL